MYFKLEEALREIETRQKDFDLLRKVEEFLGTSCPVPRGRHGFLARQIASARFEEIFFASRCREAGLEPVTLEYPEDRFITTNPDKVALVRVTVFFGRGKRGGPRLEMVDLVRRLGAINGLPFSRISTRWGEPLVAFHHRTRAQLGLGWKVFDLSSWLKALGPARAYYPYLLALFLGHGVLFEDFDAPDPGLETFRRKIVTPSFEWVTKKFGVPPLIVRHSNLSDGVPDMDWYPPEILGAIPPP